MALNKISERNPYLDEMQERGWAWVHVSADGDKYGAPHTDDEHAARAVERHSDPSNIAYQQELRIISFDR